MEEEKKSNLRRVLNYKTFPSSLRLGFQIVAAVKVALIVVCYFNGSVTLCTIIQTPVSLDRGSLGGGTYSSEVYDPSWFIPQSPTIIRY